MIKKIRTLEETPSIAHLPIEIQKKLLDLMWDAIGRKFKSVKGNKRLRTRWRAICHFYKIGALKNNLKKPRRGV